MPRSKPHRLAVPSKPAGLLPSWSPQATRKKSQGIHDPLADALCRAPKWLKSSVERPSENPQVPASLPTMPLVGLGRMRKPCLGGEGASSRAWFVGPARFPGTQAGPPGGHRAPVGLVVRPEAAGERRFLVEADERRED